MPDSEETNKARILIVEDEAVIGFDLCTRLANAGYLILGHVYSAENALKLIEGNLPDLILMDIRLQEKMDGVDAAEIIRSRWGIPIIFTTAHADMDRIKRAKLVNPFGYILKPYNDREVEIAIEMALYVAKVDAQRRKVEEELREALQFNREVIMHMRDGVVVHGPDLRYKVWNSAMERISGKNASEVIGRHPEELFPFIKEVGMLDMLKDCLENGTTRTVDFPYHIPYLDRSGWTMETSGPLRDASSAIVGVITTVRDITERKKADKALRESEERLRRVSDNASVGLYQCNRDWFYLSANPVYAKIVGKPLDQIVGRPVAEVIGIGAMEVIRPYVERVLSGEHVTYEAQLPYVETGRRYLQFSYAPDMDSDGQIVGWVASITDITESRRTEEALKESEQKFSIMFNKAAFGATLARVPDGVIVDVNERTERDLGFSREEMIGKTTTELGMNPDYETRSRIYAELQLRGSSRDVEMVLLKKDGSPIHALFSTDLVEIGGEKYVLWVAQDITRRKQSEMEDEVLANVGRVISSSLNIDEIYEAFTIQAKRIIPFDRSTINLNVQNDEAYLIAYTTGYDIPGLPNGSIIPMPGSITKHMTETKKSVLFLPASEEEMRERFPGVAAMATYRLGMPSIIAVPLIHRDRVIGGIHFRLRKPSGYSERDLMIAEKIAFQITPAIANSQLYLNLQRSEQELRVSEEKYRILFHNQRIPVIIFELDNLTLLDVNDAFLKLYGYSREEMVGRMKVTEISAEQEKSIDSYQQAVRSGTTFIPLRWHKKKDGTVFPVEIVGGNYRWRDQEVIFGMIQDITERIATEESMKTSLREKETMLKEIHHRVKNNLQVISSLLGLQSSYLQDRRLKDIFQESMNRVRTMSMIHSHLYQSANLSRINFDLFVNDLVSNVRQAYQEQAGSVSVDVKVGDIAIGLEQSIPCGLILNEMMTNAIKHAFPADRGGKIWIQMALEDMAIRLLFKDNGIGFPATFDWRKSPSLGIRLIQILSNQLKGTADMKTNGGAEWTIRFPIQTA